MAAFDDWCTDPAITRARVDAFLAARAHRRALSRPLPRLDEFRHHGHPGVFVQDGDGARRLRRARQRAARRSGIRGCDWQAAAAQGGRAALVTADTDHFASIASWRRLAQRQAVARHEELRGHAAAARHRARTQRATSRRSSRAIPRCWRCSPRSRRRDGWPCARGAVVRRRRAVAARAARIERAFGCPLQNEYGASECLAIAYGCREGGCTSTPTG